MGLHLEDLDDVTRQLMVSEIDADGEGGGFYLSNHLSGEGQETWPRLLREAAAEGNDDSLAQTLRNNRSFKTHYERRKPKGGYTTAAVPVTAPDTLAQSQFNMYYMRALALRAKSEGRTLTIYRARESNNPRPESEAMIGQQLNPDTVLEVLRRTKGVEPDINIPMPNSGLSLRLT